MGTLNDLTRSRDVGYEIKIILLDFSTVSQMYKSFLYKLFYFMELYATDYTVYPFYNSGADVQVLEKGASMTVWSKCSSMLWGSGGIPARKNLKLDAKILQNFHIKLPIFYQ